MKDPFKQFRDNLENRPELPFEEQDWLDLQLRLDQYDRRRRPAGFAWWWLALPFCLLLLGSNTLFFLELKKARQTISNFEVRQDTLVHTQIVYIRDTIYKTRILRGYTPQAEVVAIPALLNQSSLVGTSVLEGYRRPINFQSALAVTRLGVVRPEGLGLTSLSRLTNPDLRDDYSAAGSIKTNLDVLPLPEPLAMHSNARRENLPAIPIEPHTTKHKKTLRYQLYQARPKALLLGASGGWAYPLGMDLNAHSGYSAGLQAAVEFSPALRLWINSIYFNTRFVTTRMGNDIGVPAVDPPSAEYLFRRAEVPQPVLEYSAGMQYFFRGNQKFRPFIGLGYGALSRLPYDIVYEFENPALGLEWNLDLTMKQGKFLTNLLLLRAGFEYEFSKHWLGQLGLNYRNHLDRPGLRPPNMMSLQGGLNYRF